MTEIPVSINQIEYFTNLIKIKSDICSQIKISMKIALVQQIASHDKEQNIKKGMDAVKVAANKGANLVCFAELAFDPFYPQQRPGSDVRKLAEPIPGKVTDIFSKLAREHKIIIVLNLFELDGKHTYDTSPVIDTNGEILGKTRMVHIPDYDLFHEKDFYVPGNMGAPVYQTTYGKIGIAICYDRHYPEYMRALAVAGAEVVIIPQAGGVNEWPEGLYEAEMRVAAFQNGYFTALCNRVGKESKLEFSGESFVCNPNGNVIARAIEGQEEILYCNIDLKEVRNSHAKKLFFPDRRPDLYNDWIK